MRKSMYVCDACPKIGTSRRSRSSGGVSAVVDVSEGTMSGVVAKTLRAWDGLEACRSTSASAPRVSASALSRTARAPFRPWPPQGWALQVRNRRTDRRAGASGNASPHPRGSVGASCHHCPSMRACAWPARRRCPVHFAGTLPGTDTCNTLVLGCRRARKRRFQTCEPLNRGKVKS